MPGLHADISASKLDRLEACPGSLALSRGLPNRSSQAADEGTAAHFLASESMLLEVEPRDFLGKLIRVTPQGAIWAGLDDEPPYTEFQVDDDMVGFVTQYTDFCAAMIQSAVQIWIEHAVPIGWLTGEDGAFSTLDFGALLPIANRPGSHELVDADLKYGRGKAVDQHGLQGPMYLLGLWRTLPQDLADSVHQFRFVIHQPRNGGVKEVVYTPVEMAALEQQIRFVASRVLEAEAQYNAGGMDNEFLNPTTEGCQFCPAKATCPALNAVADHVAEQATANGFSDLTQADADALAAAKARIPLLEQWIKAVEDEVRARLEAGQPVAGYKLIEGELGARHWADAEAAEKALKSLRLPKDTMYEHKLISPTSAEKLVQQLGKDGVLKKGHEDRPITARQWEKVRAHIARKNGAPIVVAESDPRPAIARDSFANL
jgi:hypothetical protein